MLKYRKMYDASESLKVKKRKKTGKYASMIEDFGIKNDTNEDQEREERRLMEDDAKNNTTSPVKLNSSPNNFIDTKGKSNSLKYFVNQCYLMTLAQRYI